ncbi:MAG: DUF370 domain-containing protein [Clostridiales bacterium]|nr:DUF370 domain-containing protein [Clostridiales bacterium]
MYLYLGGDAIIKTDEIIGIFDIDTSTVNKATRDCLSKTEKENRIIYVNYDLPKSFIVCENNNICVCPLNTSTILKRCEREQTRRLTNE